MPEMRKVFSSHINSVGYDDETGELHVEFANGSHGHYADVPPEVAGQVLSAPSIGMELHRTVRGRHSFAYHHKVKGKK
jgi:hypothetical protein